MSDWTHEEYQKLLGMKHTALPNLADLPQHVVNSVPANDIDWRNSGVVSHVKDQGGCGSCWAFSTTGSIESARAIAGWGMYTFSEQQLVDCSWSYGNMGCGGGWYYWAWSYMQSNPLQFDWDYPYFSGQTGNSGNCNYNRGIGYANTTGQVGVAGNSSSIMSAINRGPVSVAIQADTAVFQTYSSGVITGDACGSNIDHAVLAVGYGPGYYIVKNSWGTWWGDQGYVKIEMREGAGTCGINQYVAYPTVW
jgi:C1A family cysteine protease